MRPIELKIRNFRSYFGDEAVFDFRERRLVGIVGPIGSGKSTILDAIAFALYGRTAAVGKGTKALIHQRAEHGAVAFRFDVDGDLWEAQRMLRKKGAGDHALYRLKDDTDGADKLEQITGEAEVTAKVAELLGLDFDAFGRSVLLAQGRFAEFLTARPAERDKVLKGVFGHHRIDRMRAVAKERARDAEIEAEKATVTVQHLAELEAVTAKRRDDLGADEERLASLEGIEPKVLQLNAGIKAAEAEQRSADERLEQLRSINESFPDDDRLSGTVTAALGASEQRDTAAARLKEARAGIETAEQRSHDAARTREALDAATALVTARRERSAAVVDAEQALSRGQERLKQAVAEMAGQGDRVALGERDARMATELLAEHAKELTAAEAAHHAALHADMAATLRNDLHEGEACPVCEQTVATIPTVLPAGADVEAASAAVLAAREERASSEASNTKAAAALESAKTASEEAARRKSEADSSTSELEEQLARTAESAAESIAELVALVGSEDVEDALTSMREEVADAKAVMDAATVARDRAMTDHDGAIEAEQTASKRLGDLRVALAGVAARVEDPPPIGDAPETVAEAAVALRAIVEQAVRETTKRREQASTGAEDHQKELAAILRDVDIRSPAATSRSPP